MKPIVVSGPSGGGKSTIIAKAMETYPNSFAFSVSRKFFIYIYAIIHDTFYGEKN